MAYTNTYYILSGVDTYKYEKIAKYDFIHENLIKLYDFDEKNKIAIVEKGIEIFTNAGDIIIQIPQSQEERIIYACFLLLDIGTVLDYMFSKYRMIYSDVKPSNIVLKNSDQLQFMLCDLESIDMGDSYALIEEEIYSLESVTPGYVAPEWWVNGCEKCASETFSVYSLAMTVYYMLTQEDLIPYRGDKHIGYITMYSQFSFDKLNDTNICPLWLKDLLIRMTNKKPQERPTYNEILSHEQLTKITQQQRPQIKKQKINQDRIITHIPCIPDIRKNMTCILEPTDNIMILNPVESIIDDGTEKEKTKTTKNMHSKKCLQNCCSVM